jgi:hypothetical protein
MAVAIEGTPTKVADGENYTAETSGSNRLVVLVAHARNSNDPGSITGITMGSTGATLATNQGNQNQTASAVGYIKDADIPSGANAITVSVNNTLDSAQIHCFTLSGADQTTPEKDSGGGNSSGNSADVTHSSTTSTNGGMFVGGAQFDAFTNRTWSPPTGWTEDLDVGADVKSACSAHLDATGSADAGTWSMDASRNGNRTCAVLSVEPASAAGGGLPAGSLSLLGVGI